MLTQEYKPRLPRVEEYKRYNKYAWMRRRQLMKQVVANWRRQHGLEPLSSCLSGSSFWVTPSGGAYRK